MAYAWNAQPTTDKYDTQEVGRVSDLSIVDNIQQHWGDVGANNVGQQEY